MRAYSSSCVLQEYTHSLCERHPPNEEKETLMLTVKAEAYAGSQINGCIEQAIHACSYTAGTNDSGTLPHRYSFYVLEVTVEFNQDGVSLTFEFNGVTVTVREDSDPELIYRDWSRALSGMIDKNVGPYPNPVLTDEEKENDARVEAENEQRRQQRQAEYQAAADVKRNATEARLTDAPAMEIADQAIWEDYKSKNQDGYGGGIIAYAERWARLMQVEINAGKKLENVAEATSHEADTDGITGFMYGAAVHTLASCWKHGDQLRKWHNKQYGVSEDTEGTVNPAIITVG